MGDIDSAEDDVNDIDGGEGGEESDTAEDEGSDEGSDDDSDDASGDEGDESDDDAAGTDKTKKQGKDDDDVVPSRKPKTPADWVALRRGNKIEKITKSKQGGTQGGNNDDGADDEEDIDPKVAAAVEKMIKPLFDQQGEQEVETEIATFVTNNPDFKPFEARVKKWADHDSWKGVPIEQIFYAAAGKELLSIGAARKVKADNNAKKGRTGGGGGGEESRRTSWNDAPLEDVGKEIERVKMGGK